MARIPLKESVTIITLCLTACSSKHSSIPIPVMDNLCDAVNAKKNGASDGEITFNGKVGGDVILYSGKNIDVSGLVGGNLLVKPKSGEAVGIRVIKPMSEYVTMGYRWKKQYKDHSVENDDVPLQGTYHYRTGQTYGSMNGDAIVRLVENRSISRSDISRISTIYRTTTSIIDRVRNRVGATRSSYNQNDDMLIEYDGYLFVRIHTRRCVKYEVATGSEDRVVTYDISDDRGDSRQKKLCRSRMKRFRSGVKRKFARGDHFKIGSVQAQYVLDKYCVLSDTSLDEEQALDCETFDEQKCITF